MIAQAATLVEEERKVEEKVLNSNILGVQPFFPQTTKEKQVSSKLSGDWRDRAH